MHNRSNTVCSLSLIALFFLIACNVKDPEEKQLVKDPKSIDVMVQKNIGSQLSFAADHGGFTADSILLNYYKALKIFYESKDYSPIWSSRESWKPMMPALLNYIDQSATDGLYKNDYHFKEISSLKQTLDKDSVLRMDAVLWTKADLLCTDALMHIMQDLHQGRLVPDSQQLHFDSEKFISFFTTRFEQLNKGESLDLVFKSIQPGIQGYWNLKQGIKKFVDSMDTRSYTYIPYPYKTNDQNDSLAFVKKLLKRLGESGIKSTDEKPDSTQLAGIVKKYQQQYKISADGKVNASLVKLLNQTDSTRFMRIAVTLDRYKQLPDSMPEKYILVNLPAYNLQVWAADTVALTSKIICGKPNTSTPFITSTISDIVIFPTWTVPSSIIKKEMLPGLKKSAGYLARKGLRLYNSKGELIDPYSINWGKYSKGIPYKIQQGSGDGNALGVIKFNFKNAYDVYLHDTNQRYLFKNSIRALSHGCVRVQEWEKLAFFIVRNDSMHVNNPDSLKYNTDSITSWIAKKQQHRIEVKNKIPLFIRYFGCEGLDGKIRFYDDIYDEDKKAIENFFGRK